MTYEILGQYLDPVALVVVGLGCMLVAIVQNGLRMAGSAMLAAGHMAAPRKKAERARLSVVMIEDCVRRRGVSCADRVKATCAFARKLGMLMSDAPGFEAYRQATESLLEAQETQRTRIVQVWNDIADAAPALGMLGTILGLVQMFARMETAEGIGGAMAICLLTSLYGLVFAHLAAGPIARRLEMLGRQEADWQNGIAQRMIALARREYPDGAASRLSLVPSVQPSEPQPQAQPPDARRRKAVQ